ncbi:hypothetical protein [uncultured Kordia sp.]|uniref:hypothetical protein n=1 Tax=uncultured Kordia sp. TaxID=507699 RepID=UPI00260B5F6C|nr:hypothetical protein [uncultured Kordia sp.]
MMTKKTINSILYALVLLLFILLFVFTGSSEKVVKQFAPATAQTISNEDVVKTLNLQPYNELQTEVADLQTKVNDTTNLLYFKRQGKTVFVQLLDHTGTASQPMILTLDDTDTYNFNFSDYKDNDFAILIKSNMGNVALNPNSKWTESKYASADFPALLGWNAAFTDKFKTLRKQKVTQNGAQVGANTTKSIHFFLWSTIEYLKSEQKDKLLYTIVKDGNKYSSTSDFFDFNHKTTRINHINDSTNQIKAYKEKFKNATSKSFTFTKNNDELTLVTDEETIVIPIRAGDAISVANIGKIAPTVEQTVKKALTPILTNLQKTDASISNWTQTKYKKTTFAKALDLPIRTSRWKQFVAVNKAEDVFDFFIETIAFQLDETNHNAVTLEANTISLETTSKLTSTGNALSTNILLGLGILTSLFLLIREQLPQVFSRKKDEDEDEDEVEVEVEVETELENEIEDELEVEVETETVVNVQQDTIVANTKSDEEIVQHKLKNINSLQEVSKLPWTATIQKDLAFLIRHKEEFSKLIFAKDKEESVFLNTLEEVYPRQINKLASQKENAELWNDFTAVETKSELKKFLKSHKNAIKGLPDLLEIGLKYEQFDTSKSFIEALKVLAQEKKFTNEIDVLSKLKDKYPKDSIDSIINFITNTDATLSKGAKTANSVPELLPYVATWYKTYTGKNAPWNNVIEKVAAKQQQIQKETNTVHKLAHIQDLYQLITNHKEDVLTELLTQFKKETHKLKQDAAQQIDTIEKASAEKIKATEKTAAERVATTQKAAETEISNIKAQAQQTYEALETSKKTTDNNNKLAEKYFANLYDPHIKEFQNKARDFDNAELTKRLAFIAFNAMDLAKFVNDNWSADVKTEGNIRRILRRESLSEIPKENFDPNAATSYINTIVAFLHKNGVKEVEHLIDGIDINEELKGLH